MILKVMLWANVLVFGGQRDHFLAPPKFAYNNWQHSRIWMALFEDYMADVVSLQLVGLILHSQDSMVLSYFIRLLISLVQH